MFSFLIQPTLYPLKTEETLHMFEFQMRTFIFGHFPQLINELAAVDYRLSPQYRELLSGGEKYNGSRMRMPVRKERVR